MPMAPTDKPRPSPAEHARKALHFLPFWSGPARFLPLHRKFLWAFIPLLVGGVYLFGWRSLVLVALCHLTGWLISAGFAVIRRKPMDATYWITAWLVGLSLPAHVPLWLPVIAVFIGQLFGKEAFGGFGRNVFNPALVGRAFVTISFPTAFAGYWWKPFWGGAGGLIHWSPLPATPDAVPTATPLASFKGSGAEADLLDMLLGRVSGAIGETAALLLLLLGSYLLLRKVINWRTPTAVLTGAAAASLILHAVEPGLFPGVPYTLAAGGLLFGAFFFATDPVSSPSTNQGRWIMGAFIGVMVVVIRGLSSFAGGVLFAILLANTFTPLVDSLVKGRKKRKEKPST